MTVAIPKVNGPIALKNVAAFMTLATQLIDRSPHLPGIGVCYGPSGYGKTYASIFCQNKTRAVRVEVGESWTRATFLRMVLIELGVEPRGTISGMAERAKAALGDNPRRPLIVDEADKIVDKGYIELVRELQEHSGAPVLLIGEEKLPTKLERIERVANRVLDWMPAQPCDIEDAHHLANAFCPNLTISEDLLDEIRRQSQGRARRIVVNLAQVQEIARNRGITAVDRSAWGRAEFYTSKAPRARRDIELAVA
ncbi:ATP-binding protein [Ancylobacter dichloromethanicus]|uniref:Transposase n=1 Tax=Ancylobacter dichloromethanicus TaxID=518825 RepID=A0A9W6JEU3_9HYPH|nr:ATP-binding protein [Ancylobacter dichloromethanicus]MBS7552062.1 ATP-binding protein [Ancylobacter dichloromethanicus]GLK74699.1 transposase [Ancylobacter dichloromethanicus]